MPACPALAGPSRPGLPQQAKRHWQPPVDMQGGGGAHARHALSDCTCYMLHQHWSGHGCWSSHASHTALAAYCCQQPCTGSGAGSLLPAALHRLRRRLRLSGPPAPGAQLHARLQTAVQTQPCPLSHAAAGAAVVPHTLAADTGAVPLVMAAAATTPCAPESAGCHLLWSYCSAALAHPPWPGTRGQ